MNDLAYMIMLIFPYQMKAEVVFVVLAVKHLGKTKRNVRHAALIQKTSYTIMPSQRKTNNAGWRALYG